MKQDTLTAGSFIVIGLGCLVLVTIAFEQQGQINQLARRQAAMQSNNVAAAQALVDLSIALSKISPDVTVIQPTDPHETGQPTPPR